MAEEMVLKLRRAANTLYSRNENLRSKISLFSPFIIAMKGDPHMGRKLAAFYLASIFRCPLIKEYDFEKYEEKSEENQARLWRNIRNLACINLRSGRSIVIDTELANPYEFNQLKELSETISTRLVVFEYRVGDAERLWTSQYRLYTALEEKGMNPFLYIFADFLKKPGSSHYIHSTNYNMGEIPKITMHVDHLSSFEDSVYGALEEFQVHINPNFEFEQVNDCNHNFTFMGIEYECKRLCFQCRELVWGPVYCCCQCTFIIHRTCSRLPKSLTMGKFKSYPIGTLNLRYVGELDIDASCSCCKQLIRCSSTSSQYYSSDDGLVFFDLDCLFLLPAKLRTKIHKHELIRDMQSYSMPIACYECKESIHKMAICYSCETCSVSFDVYCLWLPETVEFNRHRHPFKLSVAPAVDSDPYYCEFCANERDTDRWVYCCAECDYFVHPRCIVKSPCLPRPISTEIFTTNTKSKEQLTEDTKFHHLNSHMPTEGARATEPPSPHILLAKMICLLFKESTKEIEFPIIIAVKGNSHVGKETVVFALAAAFDNCFLIDEDSLSKVTNIEPKQVCYQEFSKIALSQLQTGLSVVFDCDLSYESDFLILRDFAIVTETPLFIVECKPCDEDNMITNSRSEYEYDVGDIPKLLVNILTLPTPDDFLKIMAHILNSISAYSRECRKGLIKEPDIPSCYEHRVDLGSANDVFEGDICNRCSKQFSTQTHKCKVCDLVIHKTCTMLPLHIRCKTQKFVLEEKRDCFEETRCVCCTKLVKDYAYRPIATFRRYNCLCLDCWFTPPKPGVDVHEHPMRLRYGTQDFDCQACGSVCTQKLRYVCTDGSCDFVIGVNCGWLKETVTFDRHCHPFYLGVSPEHVSNQYVCTICEKERDNKHWVYGCIGCEFFIHIHCLVPAGGCPPPSETWYD